MDYIVRELRNRQVCHYRLNSEELPETMVILGNHSQDDWSIKAGDFEIRGSDIKSAYFRRPGIPQFEINPENIAQADYLKNEWNALLKNIYWRIGSRWLNAPACIFLGEDKPRQLIIARQIGFNVPISLITNDVDEVINYQKEYTLVAKPLKHALLEDVDSVVFTSRVPKIDKSASNSIKQAPIIFQEEIKKIYDVRVTVVGNQVFSCAIDSQTSEESSVDWRKGSNIDLAHTVIELPDDVRNKCIEITRNFGLKFSAIDLILDVHNKYWFLEINPNGQWAWIENRTGLKLSKAIVDTLISISYEGI